VLNFTYVSVIVNTRTHTHTQNRFYRKFYSVSIMYRCTAFVCLHSTESDVQISCNYFPSYNRSSVHF